MRKKLLMEMAPRRASDRIASKAQSREEEEIQEESERQRERERAAEERRKEEEEKQREKQQQAEKRQQGRGTLVLTSLKCSAPRICKCLDCVCLFRLLTENS